MLLSENNFKLDFTGDLQTMYNSNILLKVKAIPHIWRTSILNVLSLLVGERDLAYLKTYYHATSSKFNFLTESRDT